MRSDRNNARSALIFIHVLAGLMVMGCASTSGGLTDEEIAAIPETAYEIHLYADRSPDDYIGYIRRRLEVMGFTIADYSPADHTVRTASMDIGRNVSLAIFGSTDTDMNVSKTIARFSGLVSGGVGVARWSRNGDNRAYAFRELLDYVLRIEHDSVVYAVQE